MEFGKLHGLGNDFIIARVGESDGYRRSLASLSKKVCDRHRGVGADGIVYYQATRGDHEADFSAMIFNADGSRAEMSGNGVRCLAAYLTHKGEHRSTVVRIRTVSGIKTVTLTNHENLVYHFQCAMGCPVTDLAKIPALIEGEKGPLLDYPLSFEGKTVSVSLCSMGNPHCSTFWANVEEAPVSELGAKLERHPAFPNRTNVEFIQLVDRQRIKVRFWERGVGQTLSSGTGSSAAAVAAILRGLADSPLTVESELGCVLVGWNPGQELKLTGPAEFICAGEYAAGAEEE